MILAIPVTLARLDLVYEAVGLLLQLCLEFLGGDALELRACVLHGSAARNGHLRHVVDVGAGLQHAQEVLLQDELLVLARHAKLVAVRGRVLVELGAVGFIAEGEEQLVQRIRTVRVLAVEHIGARNIFVVVFGPRGHVPTPDVNTCMGSIVARRRAEASGRRQPLTPTASRSGLRCRCASYRSIPQATDTLRLSTLPTWGRRTTKSQCRRVSSRSPSPSPPITSAREPPRSACQAIFSPVMSAPAIHNPASFSSFMLRERLVTLTSGVVSAAPAATLRTVAFIPAARSFGTTTASAPQASAVRRQAPRLCGSCTPSSSRTRGSRLSVSACSRSASCQAGRDSTSAITPWCATSPTLPAMTFASARSAFTPAACASCSSSRMRASSRRESIINRRSRAGARCSRLRTAWMPKTVDVFTCVCFPTRRLCRPWPGRAPGPGRSGIRQD